MHISLDSAIGQQRRLNQVGETITSIATPAAAYSLRSLTGGDPKVVRVRRESDNTERDFTASDVNSGALVDFVNTQTVKPLDTRALNSGGSGDRDGDFQIASAAYSLRSLGDRQATVSATGDTVTAADGKYVVQVRRSSDDTIKSFTADEVTDGTLLAFVNNVTIYQSDFSAGVNGWSETSTSTLLGNQDGVSDSAGTSKDDVLKATKANDTQGYFERNQGVVAGLSYTVSGSFLSLASNTAVDGISIKDGQAGSSLSNYPSGYLVSNGVWTDFSFSYTATASGTQRINFGISSLGSSPNDSSTGSTGDIVYIADLKFVETTSNGFVRTWYDQSVTDQGGGTATGNHAVQTTASEQPKIVSSGVLLTKGVTFDGTNDSLALTSTLGQTNLGSSFSVVELDSTTSTKTIIDNRDSGSDGFVLFHKDDAFQFKFASTTETVSSDSTSQLIVSAFKTSSNQGIGVNGGTLEETSNTSTINVSSVPVIGSRSFSGSSNISWDGEIAELILYNSDQSSNRTAIETNINSHYSLF